MTDAEEHRVVEVILALGALETPLKYWPRDVKAMIKIMEGKVKDAKVAKEERDLCKNKRIPAANKLLKSIEIALPAVSGAMGAKLDKMANGQEFLQAVGAGALVLAGEVPKNMKAFDQTLMVNSVRYLRSEALTMSLFRNLAPYEAALSGARGKMAALRTPMAPARPAAAAPPVRPANSPAAQAAARMPARPAPPAKPAAAPVAPPKSAAAAAVAKSAGVGKKYVALRRRYTGEGGGAGAR